MRNKTYCILLTAFYGTSSEGIIKNFENTYDKLILVNDKAKSVKQLMVAIEERRPDYIISFGQKPLIKDKIYIERCGREQDVIYQTDFEVRELQKFLEQAGLVTCTSNYAGSSYCNHIFVSGLKYIREKEYSCKMVFLHVPFEKNISNRADYISRIKWAVEAFVKK